jgi:hypothetical protein
MDTPDPVYQAQSLSQEGFYKRLKTQQVSANVQRCSCSAPISSAAPAALSAAALEAENKTLKDAAAKQGNPP